MLVSRLWDNGNWRESRLAFHQAMNVILICVPRASKEQSDCSAIYGKDLLHLSSISEQELFPVLTHKDQVREEEKLGRGR
jgi:hypothetical protein